MAEESKKFWWQEKAAIIISILSFLLSVNTYFEKNHSQVIDSAITITSNYEQHRGLYKDFSTLSDIQKTQTPSILKGDEEKEINSRFLELIEYGENVSRLLNSGLIDNRFIGDGLKCLLVQTIRVKHSLAGPLWKQYNAINLTKYDQSTPWGCKVIFDNATGTAIAQQSDDQRK